MAKNQVITDVGLDTAFFDFETGLLESPEIAIGHINLLLLHPQTCITRIALLRSLSGDKQTTDLTDQMPVIEAIAEQGVGGAYENGDVRAEQLIRVISNPEALRVLFQRCWPVELPLPQEFVSPVDVASALTSDSETVPAAVAETIPAPVEGAEIDPDQTAAELWKSGKFQAAIGAIRPVVERICSIIGNMDAASVLECLKQRAEISGDQNKIANAVSECLRDLTGNHINLAELLLFCAIDALKEYPKSSAESAVLTTVRNWRLSKKTRGLGEYSDTEYRRVERRL